MTQSPRAQNSRVWKFWIKGDFLLKSPEEPFTAICTDLGSSNLMDFLPALDHFARWIQKNVNRSNLFTGAL